ncbi:phosphotransferase [Roseovarius aestuarii]|nr:phosphotransferase [Roseovarius aestuarii]
MSGDPWLPMFARSIDVACTGFNSVDAARHLRFSAAMQDTPPLSDLDAMQYVTSSFYKLKEADHAMASAELGDLIRHVPGKRAIMTGVMNGRNVIFRLDFNDQDGTSNREWEEMLRLWPYMAEGDFRTAEPIYANPDLGLIVQEYVAGTPMLQHFWSIDTAARAPYLGTAAAWLRKATAMTEGWRLSNPAGWIKRAAKASSQQPFPHLRAYEVDILDQMNRLSHAIEPENWRVGITHGDFHPNNLIVNGTRLTGIDTGGSRTMPLCKDMARFLMHMGRRRVEFPGSLSYGVSQIGLDAFAAAFELQKHERDVVLPFFLAFEALIRVENTGLSASRIKRAEKMYRDLLPDLAAIKI